MRRRSIDRRQIVMRLGTVHSENAHGEDIESGWWRCSRDEGEGQEAFGVGM